jgi:hypothetical protein
MLRQKLLKAPTRVLLLTLLVSARMTVASATTPHLSSMPAHASHPAAAARSRTRQKIDYPHIEGIQRWGLNE